MTKPEHAPGVETTAELQEKLNQLQYIPVLTAHPTEARRDVVLLSLRRIFALTLIAVGGRMFFSR